MFKLYIITSGNWFVFRYIIESLEILLDGLPILPELFLLSTTLLLFIYGIFRKNYIPNARLVKEFIYFSITILTITSFLVWVSLNIPARLLYENLLVLDFGSSSIKLLCLLVSIICLIMAESSLIRSRSVSFEYFILYLFVVFGIMFFISSIDLFSMFLSLEVQSICLYALVALNKNSGSGVEAGIKFFVLGATSSVILIFGISMLYGSVGSTNLFHVYNILLYHVPNLLWNTIDAGMFCGWFGERRWMWISVLL
jgi:NADH-quinone oxidoreductase subunit N